LANKKVTASRMPDLGKFPQPLTRQVVDQIQWFIACWKEEKKGYKIWQKQFPMFIFSIFTSHFIFKTGLHISMFIKFWKRFHFWILHSRFTLFEVN